MEPAARPVTIFFITVTADIATEDGANQLNNGGWTTLTINPSGSRTLSGSVNSFLISLNGTNNVTIDGLNSGGNFCLFQYKYRYICKYDPFSQ